MPLTYRHIQGRADFQPLLDHVIQETKGLLPPKAGEWPAIESIVMQLDAIRRWTANNRDPTLSERKSISLGKLVVREFEPTPDKDIALLNEQLLDLADYVKRWLTDQEMAAFDTDDLMSDFYEWEQ